MNTLDERLRASDPSYDVDPPDDVLSAIRATPRDAPALPRTRSRRRIWAGAVATAACAAFVLGVTLPGNGGRGPSFVARAYAQSELSSADQVVHIVERFDSQVGDIHQVDTSESWQHGVQWHLKTSDVETGGRDFSDTEEKLFDGDVIRSWFSKAPSQVLRATDGEEAARIIERSRRSPLDRFRAAYQDQELADLGIVDFAGRKAHAYRTTLRDTHHHDVGLPVFVGEVATFYFDPDSAVPLGSTQESPTGDGPEWTNVISTWEELPATPENLRSVAERG